MDGCCSALQTGVQRCLFECMGAASPPWIHEWKSPRAARQRLWGGRQRGRGVRQRVTPGFEAFFCARRPATQPLRWSDLSVGKRGVRVLSRSLGDFWEEMHGGSGRATPQRPTGAHIFGPSPGSEAAGCCTHMHGDQKWFTVVPVWFDGGTGNRRSGPHNPPGRECPASEAPRDFTSEVDASTWIPPSACRYLASDAVLEFGTPR